MKLVLTSALLDLILILIFRLTNIRIPLFLLLAGANILFYLILLGLFLRKTSGQKPVRKGYLLEFVCMQFFLCTGLFLFKLTDLMIKLNSR